MNTEFLEFASQFTIHESVESSYVIVIERRLQQDETHKWVIIKRELCHSMNRPRIYRKNTNTWIMLHEQDEILEKFFKPSYPTFDTESNRIYYKNTRIESLEETFKLGVKIKLEFAK